MESLQSREEYLNDINEFIKSQKNKLNKLLDALNWTEENVKAGNDVVCCKYNENHKLPNLHMKLHEERCKLKSEGYDSETLEKEASSSRFFYSDSKTVFSVQIDKDLQDKILIQSHFNIEDVSKKALPMTAERAKVLLSPQERLAIYEYLVKESKEHVKREEISLEKLKELPSEDKKEESSKQKSRLEILAEQRDYKRRRQSYRAKNVHITKRTYTEEIREVIETQIGSWNKYLQDSNKGENSSSKHEKKSDYNGNGRPLSKSFQQNSKSFEYSYDGDHDRNRQRRSSKSRSRERLHHRRHSSSSDVSYRSRSRHRLSDDDRHKTSDSSHDESSKHKKHKKKKKKKHKHKKHRK